MLCKLLQVNTHKNLVSYKPLVNIFIDKLTTFISVVKFSMDTSQFRNLTVPPLLALYAAAFLQLV